MVEERVVCHRLQIPSRHSLRILLNLVASPDANLHRIPKRGKYDGVLYASLGILGCSTGCRLPSLLQVIC